MKHASKENKVTYMGQDLHKLDQNKIYKLDRKTWTKINVAKF